MDKKDTQSDFDETHRQKIEKDIAVILVTENGQNTFLEVNEKKVTMAIHKLSYLPSPGSDRIGSLTFSQSMSVFFSVH